MFQLAVGNRQSKMSTVQPEISKRCLSCGASVRAQAMFCPECGQPLSQAGDLETTVASDAGAVSPNAGQAKITKVNRAQNRTTRPLPRARAGRRVAVIARRGDLRNVDHKIQEIWDRNMRHSAKRPLPQPFSSGPEQQRRARLCIAHQLLPKKRWKIT
jgi:hypothetical protein